MLGYLSADIICSEWRTVPSNLYATRVVLKIGEYPRIFPSFSWGIFTHVTRLDQSHERKYLMDFNNLLLTEREGRTGEYWPEAVAVNDRGPIFPSTARAS